MLLLVLANILAFLGMLLLIYSMFAKSKKNMLLIQIGNYFFSAASNLLVGSYAAASANVISAVRNFALAKQDSLLMTVIISVSYVVIGLATNTLGVVGLLPIAASVEFTIWAHCAKTVQGVRYGVILNLILWLIHDICMQLYAAILTDVLLVATTIAAMIKCKQVNEVVADVDESDAGANADDNGTDEVCVLNKDERK